MLADVPYSAAEAQRLGALIERINEHPLDFVVHVGDVGSSNPSQACSDAWLVARKAQFAQLRAPWVVMPGDNEWTDCAKHGLDPRQRLAAWRRLFCRDAAGLALERQPGHCENARWRSRGAAFVALNVPGGSAPALDDARMASTLEWLDESLAQAEARGDAPIVVFLHADPRFERVGPDDAYARLRGVLATHARWFKDRLVLVHGDTHVYRDDAPLAGMRRLEPWGSPFVSWLRVTRSGARLRAETGW